MYHTILSPLGPTLNLTHEDALAACAPKETLYVPSTEEVLTVTATAADLVKLEGEGEGEGETDHTVKEEEEVREVVEVVMGVDNSAVEMKEVDDAVKEVVETAAAEMGSETVAMDADGQTQVANSADTLSAQSPPVPAIVPLPTVSVITSAVTAAAVTASAVTAAAVTGASVTASAVTGATVTGTAVVVTIAPTIAVELPIRSKPAMPSVLLCPMVLTLPLRFLSLTFTKNS